MKEEQIDSDEAEIEKKPKRIRRGASPAATHSGGDVGDDSGEFLVVLTEIGKAGLGIEVDWANRNTLFVKGLKDAGAVPEWNKEHGDRPVRAGDEVVAVNGKGRGEPKVMLAECRGKTKLELRVMRGTEATAKRAVAEGIAGKDKDTAAGAPVAPVAEPAPRNLHPAKLHHFVVVLDMTRFGNLGLDVDWSDGRTLFVKDVLPGAIDEWNKAHVASQVVHTGDRVVAVNGYSDDPEEMVRLCRELVASHQQLQLLMQGPPAPPPKTKVAKK